MTKFKIFIKNLSLSKIIDFCILNIALTLICFTWLRFITKKTYLSILITFVIVLIINIIYQIIRKRKKQINESKINKNKQLENYFTLLIAQSEEENSQLFLNLLHGQDFKISNLSKNLLYSPTLSKGIYLFFSKKEIEYEDIVKIIYLAKKQSIKELEILCSQCNQKNKMLFENINEIKIDIKEKEDIIKQFLTNNQEIYLESVFTIKNKEKVKFKQLMILSLNKDKSKKYFLSGILIFLCSLIVKYNIYYVVMSSFLFLLSILSLKPELIINNKKESKK